MTDFYADPPFVTLLDGTTRKVLYTFTHERVIVEESGLAVLCDHVQNGKYELSGIPATPEELPTLNAYVAKVTNTTTVTKPDGSSETFENS